MFSLSPFLIIFFCSPSLSVSYLFLTNFFNFVFESLLYKQTSPRQKLTQMYPLNQFVWVDNVYPFFNNAQGISSAASYIKDLQLQGDTFKLYCGANSGPNIHEACKDKVGFTTHDRDNDKWIHNCAKDNAGFLGGNWYTDCYQSSMWHSNSHIYSYKIPTTGGLSGWTKTTGISVWFLESDKTK